MGPDYGEKWRIEEGCCGCSRARSHWALCPLTCQVSPHPWSPGCRRSHVAAAETGDDAVQAARGLCRTLWFGGGSPSEQEPQGLAHAQPLSVRGDPVCRGGWGPPPLHRQPKAPWSTSRENIWEVKFHSLALARPGSVGRYEQGVCPQNWGSSRFTGGYVWTQTHRERHSGLGCGVSGSHQEVPASLLRPTSRPRVPWWLFRPPGTRGDRRQLPEPWFPHR